MLQAEKLLLSCRETAKALGISERMLWGITKRGELACVRVGKRVLYAISDLERWIESRTERGAG